MELAKRMEMPNRVFDAKSPKNHSLRLKNSPCLVGNNDLDLSQVYCVPDCLKSILDWDEDTGENIKSKIIRYILENDKIFQRQKGIFNIAESIELCKVFKCSLIDLTQIGKYIEQSFTKKHAIVISDSDILEGSKDEPISIPSDLIDSTENMKDSITRNGPESCDKCTTIENPF